jgi:hypothetical protein
VVAASTAVLRPLLRTRAGRLLPKLARLDFDGRRSGRRFRVVTGWYRAGGQDVVFTPATWRANFAGGRTVDVWQGGRCRPMHARLELDSERVSAMLREVIGNGTAPASVGLRIPDGHVLDAADVSRLDRAAVVFSSED